MDFVQPDDQLAIEFHPGPQPGREIVPDRVQIQVRPIFTLEFFVFQSGPALVELVDVVDIDQASMRLIRL